MSVLDSYMKDLAELVNKDRGTANIAGVTEAAKIMKGHLESIGFKADLVDLGPNAGNGLFATNKPIADHYDVLFNAHLDTVFPDGTAAARPLTVKGDRAYGPGCSACNSFFTSKPFNFGISADVKPRRASILSETFGITGALKIAKMRIRLLQTRKIAAARSGFSLITVHGSVVGI